MQRDGEKINFKNTDIKLFNKKSGFTLVELLVVVSIIGIMATIVIADYNSEIKRSRVRIAGETIYSELQDLRIRVSSGDQRCWGVAFSEDGVSRVYSEYNDGCDFQNYVVDKEIDLGRGIDVLEGEGSVFFEPPYGDVRVFDGDLAVTVGGNGFETTIFINSLTGNVEIE